jgi:hypothetical protein
VSCVMGQGLGVRGEGLEGLDVRAVKSDPDVSEGAEQLKAEAPNSETPLPPTPLTLKH